MSGNIIETTEKGLKTMPTGLSVELNLEAIEYLISLKKKPELYRFGSVCKNNHQFIFSGYSIRLKRDGYCLLCSQHNKKQYYKNNKNKILIDNKKYQKTDKFLKYKKKYCEINKDKILEKQKKYYQENREILIEKQKNYYQENREYLIEKQKKNHEQNKDVLIKYRKKHYQDNSEYYYLNSQKRKAIKKKVTVHTITSKDIQKLLKFFNYSCAYCGVSIKNGYHLDHVKPLFNKGVHAIWNLTPSCEHCNLSKNTKNMKTWYRQQPFYNLERELRIEKWCKMQLINFQYNQGGKNG